MNDYECYKNSNKKIKSYGTVGICSHDIALLPEKDTYTCTLSRYIW